MRLNIKQIASCTGGSFVVEPIDASRLVTGLSWDSREIASGDVYVCLPGERTDGHRYIGSALQSGAACVLVMAQIPEAVQVLAREMGAAIIEVPDTKGAITDLAREWRGHLKGRVIGITGSVGKTTTKNLVRDVLSRSFTTVATAGNQNNDLGVPKTILNAEPDTQMLVVELGMCALGEIAELCSFVRPDWGVLTNVGDSHLELLGSRENIARAKAELFQALPEGRGHAFLNAASDYVDFVASEAHLATRELKCVYFDGSPDAHAHRDAADPLSGPAVWAEDIELDEQGHPHFSLHATGFSIPGAHGTPAEQSVSCTLSLRGVHTVANACAAAAVALSAGMDLNDIAAVFAEVVPEAGRQEVLRARAGFTVINDAYNASPDSMKAALSMLASLRVRGRHVAVLGDMGELGSFTRDGHELVGSFAAGLSLDRLVCVGKEALSIAHAAEAAGMDSDRIVYVQEISGVLADLEGYLEADDVVLVKASHFMELSRVVEGLVS